VVIAVGTLILSGSGTFAGRLGKDRAFAVTLLAGVAVLFAGFVIATTASATIASTGERRAARRSEQSSESETSKEISAKDLAAEALG
jgi:hypothetical protein